MSRLVFVSNQLPVQDRKPASIGCVVKALEAAIAEREGLWMGWSGKTSAGDDDSRCTEADKIIFLGRYAGNGCSLHRDLVLYGE